MLESGIMKETATRDDFLAILLVDGGLVCMCYGVEREGSRRDE